MRLFFYPKHVLVNLFLAHSPLAASSVKPSKGLLFFKTSCRSIRDHKDQGPSGCAKLRAEGRRAEYDIWSHP